MSKRQKSNNQYSSQPSNSLGCIYQIGIGVVIAIVSLFIEPIRDMIAPKFIKEFFDERKELLIHSSGIGPIKVGMSVDELKKQLLEYDFIVKNYEGTRESDDTPIIYALNSKSDTLFAALINYEMGVVVELIIFSDKFETQTNIHTGMNIEDYVKNYENAHLLYINNGHEIYEGFFPVDMQTDSTEFVAIVGYKDSEGNKVGTNYSEPDSLLLTSAKTIEASVATEFDKSAKILEIYITKNFKDPYDN